MNRPSATLVAGPTCGLLLGLALVVAGAEPVHAHGAGGAIAASPAETSPADIAGPSGSPPSRTASGDAVGIEPASSCVGCSTATAGADSAHAQARSLWVAGEPVEGGEAPANGYASGGVLRVTRGENGPAGVGIAAWEARTRNDRTGSEGHARAALVDLALGTDGGTTVTVLEGRSDAWSRPGSAHGTAESTGVQVRALGGVGQVTLLHSEARDGSRGRVSPASLDGTELRPPDGVDQGIAATLPGYVSAGVLRTTGAESSAGDVVTVIGHQQVEGGRSADEAVGVISSGVR